MPHNVDFRGRAYPIPPHLNHIGNDLSRGLLKFAESKQLGERGLRWLKIHLANLYGYDKASFDERVQFVHDHLEDIYDSAMKPLEVRLRLCPSFPRVMSGIDHQTVNAWIRIGQPMVDEGRRSVAMSRHLYGTPRSARIAQPLRI